MIASAAPGLGDPWNLTPAVWDATLIRIYEDRAMKSGDRDKFHEINMKRMLRAKRAAQEVAANG